MTVFLAWHEYENSGCDEVKLLGVFSSRERAEAAIARRRDMPGFVDHPEGFGIDEYTLDDDRAWLEGFAKWHEL